jgi:4-hydroxyphenylpyruvate dioxygenase
MKSYQQHPTSALTYDHLEFWVGNPFQAAHFYQTAFGLKPIAYGGSETGIRDRVSYVVAGGNMRFVLTGPVTPGSEIGQFVDAHGDGVRDVSFRVASVDHAYGAAIDAGARSASEPVTYREGERTLRRAAIHAFGDVVHSFIERSDESWFLPGLKAVAADQPEETGISAIDHVAISVPHGALDDQVRFYTGVLGFRSTHKETVRTANTAMNSEVVESADGSVKFPIVEPWPGPKRSQVQEYLDFNHGPGVQHVALSSDDIVSTLRTLHRRGIGFLQVPTLYYDVIATRLESMSDDIAALRELHVLVDRDEWGYLMQSFSRPMQARPTFFVEIIQRCGAKGFGSGNIKALFEAVEREQRARGNL